MSRLPDPSDLAYEKEEDRLLQEEHYRESLREELGREPSTAEVIDAINESTIDNRFDD